jgi:outer membrane murein-binding lipoprotein Lpp
MSRSPSDPPEEPTRPLPPATPPPARVVDERVVAPPVEDPYRTELLLDQLRSLRTGLAIVGLVAVAALGVALYTLLTKDEGSDTKAGASQAEVSSLADRVDALESDVKSRASKDDVNQVADDVQALSKRVDQIAKQAQSAPSSGTDKQARSSIDQLDTKVQTLTQDVKDLDQRVRDLEDQSQQQQP